MDDFFRGRDTLSSKDGVFVRPVGDATTNPFDPPPTMPEPQVCLCGHADSEHNNAGPCSFEGGCGCRAYDEQDIHADGGYLFDAEGRIVGIDKGYVPEPPKAWRASTMRHIARHLEIDAAIAMMEDKSDVDEAYTNWSAFLRAEADRLEAE